MTEPTSVLAAAAGTASFLSPCMLPVIPAFPAQLAGTSLGASGLERINLFLSAVLVALETAVYKRIYVEIPMRRQANSEEKIV